MRFWKFVLSKIEGRKPTVNQLDHETIAKNIRSGALYVLRESAAGVKEVIEVAGGPPGTGEAHLRAHQIDSIDDHPPVPEGKRGKWVHTNEVTGDIELEDLPQSDNYEYWRLKGSSVMEVKYGLLYNWYAATDIRNICADGWEVPTELHVQTLSNYLGGDTISGSKLKEVSIAYWTSLLYNSNESNFNLRGTGFKYHTSGNGFSFIRMGSYVMFLDGYFVCSYSGSWLSIISHSLVGNAYKGQGNSMRLIKSTTTLTNGQTGRYTGNDGRVYRTICIGTQEWLADNLCETKYRNGDTIPEVTDNSAWAALTTGALCAYGNDWDNVFGEAEVNYNVNSHDLVSFKDSATVEFSVTETESGEKEITAITTGLIQDKNFRYSQNVPQTIWNITHAMNKYPAVTVTDTSGNEIKGSVQHIDQNALILTFAVPFAGFANLN